MMGCISIIIVGFLGDVRINKHVELAKGIVSVSASTAVVYLLMKQQVPTHKFQAGECGSALGRVCSPPSGDKVLGRTQSWSFHLWG